MKLTTSYSNRQAFSLLRSVLFMKTKCCRQLEKYPSIPADVFVLDNEDAVHPSKRDENRDLLSRIIPQLPATQTTAVRINSLNDNSDHWKRDIETMALPSVSGFLLSKMHHESEVQEVSSLLSTLEKKSNLPENYFKIIPVIETLKSLERVSQIAKESPRNVALLYGPYDMMRDMHIHDVNAESLKMTTFQLLVAARAAGLKAINGPDTDIDSYADFEKTSLKNFRDGFSGRAALTLPQVLILNRCFTPTDKSIKDAQALLDRRQQGICTYQRSPAESRSMIGPPMVELAEQLLTKTRTQYTRPLNRRTSAHLKPKFPHKLSVTHTYRTGDEIASPFKITFDQTMRSVWDSSFMVTSKLNFCSESAKELGFRDTLVPFQLLLAAIPGLAVIRTTELAIAHLGFFEARQLLPVYHGDSLTSLARVVAIEAKGDKDIVTTLNTAKRLSDNAVVFQVIKKTLFPVGLFQRTDSGLPAPLEDSLVKKTVLDSKMPIDLVRNQKLYENELYVHHLVKAFDTYEFDQLCTILKVINDHHRNIIKYKQKDMLAIGPGVIAATLSNVCLDFGEVLYSEIDFAYNVNRVIRGDMISSVSQIKSVKVTPENPDIQEVHVVTLGIKNKDPGDVGNLLFPERLFTVKEALKPKEYEEICAEECIDLYHNIASVVSWRFLRPTFKS